jgi:glyoxylase-like metal-dependent hydrolase (beta-lactamase superfamily II)
MPTADDFQTLSDRLYHWSAYDPEVKCDLACTALRVSSGLVVIDPVPLHASAWHELLSTAPLRAVLLTNGNHVRHAVELREKYQVPLVTAVATRKDLGDVRPDVLLLENELVYSIAAIPIPGATPGETAFYFKDGGVMTLGDAIINVDPAKGPELLPDKYCTDPEQNRASLAKLLKYDFHTLTFAHGAPITDRAREQWAALVRR